MFRESVEHAAEFGTIHAEQYRKNVCPDALVIPARVAVRMNEIARFRGSWYLLGGPETFTLPELRRAHDALTGEQYDHRNFKRDILMTGMLESTGMFRAGARGRPAEIYRVTPWPMWERAVVDELKRTAYVSPTAKLVMLSRGAGAVNGAQAARELVSGATFSHSKGGCPVYTVAAHENGRAQ